MTCFDWGSKGNNSCYLISESSIHFSRTAYHFQENAGVVDIEIIREGSDLSHSSMVWCATRLSHPPSATPGQDYIPSSSQLTFGPGQTSQVNNKWDI